MVKRNNNEPDSLPVMGANFLRERREGRKEVFKLAMRIFGDVDADCQKCGGAGYETFRLEMERKQWHK